MQSSVWTSHSLGFRYGIGSPSEAIKPRTQFSRQKLISSTSRLVARQREERVSPLTGKIRGLPGRVCTLTHLDQAGCSNVPAKAGCDRRTVGARSVGLGRFWSMAESI